MLRLLASVRAGVSSNSARLVSNENRRRTVVCSNGVVACWHPPSQFPFEHTRPLELKKSDKTASALKKKAVDRLTVTAPDNVDLKEIFYTDKNEWFSRTREERLRQVSAPAPKKKD